MPDQMPISMLNDAPPTTALTQSLLLAIAHSTEPMALSDPALPDHPIIAVNAAFEAMSGYPAAEIVGRNCRMLQGPGTDPETVHRLRQVIADGAGCVEWIVNHRKDGAAFWNLLFMSPVRDGGGRIVHYFANQHDITCGLPDRLPEVRFGRAHMPPDAEAEFHGLVQVIAAAGHDGPGNARALERAMLAARRLAVVGSGLAPG